MSLHSTATTRTNKTGSTLCFVVKSGLEINDPRLRLSLAQSPTPTTYGHGNDIRHHRSRFVKPNVIVITVAGKLVHNMKGGILWTTTFAIVLVDLSECWRRVSGMVLSEADVDFLP